jgi:hypothetical protein
VKLFPNPAARPRVRETFIELLQKGKVDEALRLFKKAYLEMTRQVIEHLRTK